MSVTKRDVSSCLFVLGAAGVIAGLVLCFKVHWLLGVVAVSAILIVVSLLTDA